MIKYKLLLNKKQRRTPLPSTLMQGTMRPPNLKTLQCGRVCKTLNSGEGGRAGFTSVTYPVKKYFHEKTTLGNTSMIHLHKNPFFTIKLNNFYLQPSEIYIFIDRQMLK